MNGRTMNFFLPALVFFFLCAPGPGAAEIAGILPAPAAVSPWELAAAPQVAQGEDLYLLINGGAELVIEYGFRQALLAEYRHPDGGRLNVEIFAMDDSESAYGLFSMKKSRSSTSFPIEQQGALDDYYLNVWKGPYVITLTGLDQHRETRTGLRRLAQAVSAGIPLSGGPPRWSEKLALLFAEKPLITMVKGPLGAGNRSSCPVRPFFSAATGWILNFAHGEIMIVEYSAGISGAEIHEQLQAMLDKRKDLSWQAGPDGSIRGRDSRENLFHLAVRPPFLYFSTGGMDSEKLARVRRALEGSN